MTFRILIDGVEETATRFERASAVAHVRASVVVGATAELVADTQRENVRRRTDAVHDSIIVTNGDGRPFAPGHLAAEIGPTDWKSHLVENGTQRHGPFPFVGTSLDPHRAGFVAGMTAIARNA